MRYMSYIHSPHASRRIVSLLPLDARRERFFFDREELGERRRRARKTARDKKNETAETADRAVTRRITQSRLFSVPGRGTYRAAGRRAGFREDAFLRR